MADQIQIPAFVPGVVGNGHISLKTTVGAAALSARAVVVDPTSPTPYAVVAETLGLETIDLGGAWARAFEYAQDAEVSEPRVFADEYAAFIEDYACELHYPDLPAPSPSEYWESTR